jgi:hypothetical protein
VRSLPGFERPAEIPLVLQHVPESEQKLGGVGVVPE